jgi:hypothetical protein
LAVIAVVGLCDRVQAQTALANGNSFGYDGLTYTITNCVYTVSGSSGSCGAANAQLVAVGTTGGASIEVESATPGHPLLSLASNAGNTYDDLTFYLTVTAPSTKTTVSSFSDTLAGSGNSSYATQVTAGASSSTPSFNLSTNLTSPTATASFSSFDPTSAMPLYLNIDLKVSTMNGVGGNQGAISLNNATYGFTPAPEPASIALFGTALTGMAAVRRRSKRRGPQIESAT